MNEKEKNKQFNHLVYEISQNPKPPVYVFGEITTETMTWYKNPWYLIPFFGRLGCSRKIKKAEE